MGDAVIIGRFQVPDLHEGHRKLIDTVLERHPNGAILFLLGIPSAEAQDMDNRNPLPFAIRRGMICQAYHNETRFVYIPLQDIPGNDAVWSTTIDGLLKHAFVQSATLYGGRDSFVRHYKGKHPVCELPINSPISGTEIRRNLYCTNNADFRRGIIWARSHK